MDKDKFYSLQKDKRADSINKLLENKDQAGVAELIGISRSAFSKEMTQDDYVYISRENRYFKFIRDIKSAPHTNKAHSPEMDFLSTNLDVLKQILASCESGMLLFLNKEIYSNNGTFVNKNIRINQAIYDKFTDNCDKHFPHLKLQDLIAQSLLDFIDKYTST